MNLLISAPSIQIMNRRFNRWNNKGPFSLILSTPDVNISKRLTSSRSIIFWDDEANVLSRELMVLCCACVLQYFALRVFAEKMEKCVKSEVQYFCVLYSENYLILYLFEQKIWMQNTLRHKCTMGNYRLSFFNYFILVYQFQNKNLYGKFLLLRGRW